MDYNITIQDSVVSKGLNEAQGSIAFMYEK